MIAMYNSYIYKMKDSQYTNLALNYTYVQITKTNVKCQNEANNKITCNLKNIYLTFK